MAEKRLGDRKQQFVDSGNALSLNVDQLNYMWTLEQRAIFDKYDDPKERTRVLWNKGFRGRDLQVKRKEPK